MTHASLLDGKSLAQTIRAELAGLVAARPVGLRPPCLAVVQVGDVAASTVYVRNKARACDEVGFSARSVHLGGGASQDQLEEVVRSLSEDDEVDGVLVQLPLPAAMDPHRVMQALAPGKDVDGLHPENLGRLLLGLSGHRACTPAGVMRLLAAHGIDLAGQRVVVIGRSAIVGKPLAGLLLQADATVTVAHSKTRDLPGVTREADVVVAAVGRPHFVTAEMVRPGAVVVDVGINRLPDGRVVGDVEPAVGSVARWWSPVPGGVGPMTIAMLLENTWRSYALRHGLEA